MWSSFLALVGTLAVAARVAVPASTPFLAALRAAGSALATPRQDFCIALTDDAPLMLALLARLSTATGRAIPPFVSMLFHPLWLLPVLPFLCYLHYAHSHASPLKDSMPARIFTRALAAHLPLLSATVSIVFAVAAVGNTACVTSPLNGPGTASLLGKTAAITFNVSVTSVLFYLTLALTLAVLAEALPLLIVRTRARAAAATAATAAVAATADPLARAGSHLGAALTVILSAAAYAAAPAAAAFFAVDATQAIALAVAPLTAAVAARAPALVPSAALVPAAGLGAGVVLLALAGLLALPLRALLASRFVTATLPAPIAAALSPALSPAHATAAAVAAAAAGFPEARAPLALPPPPVLSPSIRLFLHAPSLVTDGDASATNALIAGTAVDTSPLLSPLPVSATAASVLPAPLLLSSGQVVHTGAGNKRLTCGDRVRGCFRRFTTQPPKLPPLAPLFTVTGESPAAAAGVSHAAVVASQRQRRAAPVTPPSPKVSLTAHEDGFDPIDRASFDLLKMRLLAPPRSSVLSRVQVRASLFLYTAR